MRARIDFNLQGPGFDYIVKVLHAYATKLDLELSIAPVAVVPGPLNVCVIIEWIHGPYDPHKFVELIAKGPLGPFVTQAKCIENDKWVTLFIPPPFKKGEGHVG